MNTLKKIWAGFTSRMYGFWRGQDIALDNLVLDDGVDHTISGDSARYPALKPLKTVLDATLPGGPHGAHCENAQYDDDAQEEALNQAESGK